MEPRLIDAIDRNHLLNIISEHLSGVKPDGAYKKGFIKAMTIAENTLKDRHQTPTLDYAPVRHGEWKRTEVARGNEMHTLYVCSECNDYIGFREDPGAYTVRGNYLYCRMCGAKMDGGNKDG